MTKKVLIESRELEAMAEKDGGYVAPPWSLPSNPEGERDFSRIRQYSLKHGKPISKLTAEDYRRIGVSQP